MTSMTSAILCPSCGQCAMTYAGLRRSIATLSCCTCGVTMTASQVADLYDRATATVRPVRPAPPLARTHNAGSKAASRACAPGPLPAPREVA